MKSNGKINESTFRMLHTSNFNFNDNLIDIASRFWLKLAEDRLINF